MKKDFYDKSELFNEEIKPLMKKLKVACNMAKIPMFATAAIKNTKSGTVYSSEVMLASANVKLENDSITALLLRLNGFEVNHPPYIQKAVRELSGYVEQLSQESTDRIKNTLTDDKISDMDKIVNGKCSVSVPSELVSKPIDDDIFE